MFQSTTLTGVQFILIGIGLLFQVLAVSAMRRETSLYRGCTPKANDETPEEPHDLGTPAPKKSEGPILRRATSRDYYEMEKTPPGVAPAELLRTAKVTYFQH